MPQHPRQQPAYQALLSLLRLAGLLHKAGDRFFREFAITQTQFNVLMLLRYECEQGCTQTELGRRLLVKAANVTGLVRRLERDGLLVREPHPSDERAWWVRISGAGKKLLRRVEPAYYKRVQEVMGVHSGADLGRLSQQLDKTRQAVEGLAS